MFDDEINKDSVNDLISQLERYEKSEDDVFDLWFATKGGYLFAMDMLIAYLNKHREGIHVHIFDELHSCGYKILTDFLGKKTVHYENQMIWVWHNIDQMMYMQRKSDGIKPSKQQEGLKELNTVFYNKLLILGVTKKQIKKLENGRDIILYPKNILKLKII